MIAVRAVTRTTKPITRPSIRMSVSGPTNPTVAIGFSLRSTGTIEYASSNPAEPPTVASTMLSVRSCRTTRHLSAPSARRSAISRSRVTPRASNRLATLPQQINSKKATAAVSITSDFSIRPLRSPINSCRSQMALTVQPARSRGYSRSSSFAIAFNSASVCGKVTPGLSRATNS